MTLAKAIRILEKEYETAKKLEMVRKPLSYALYKTWRKVEEIESGKIADIKEE